MLGPREAIRQTKGACGGVTEVESSAQMPRGVRQAKYVRKGRGVLLTAMIAKQRRLAGLPSMSSSVDIPVKFYTLEAESTNNRIKAKKQRKASGFMGTIEAIRSIDAEQQEDFALAVAGLHEDLQLRKEFAKFERSDFLELSSTSTYPGFTATALESYWKKIFHPFCKPHLADSGRQL